MSAPAMIVIDTNVVSELMRMTPEPAVMTWFSGQDSAELYLTAVSEAELRAGAAILPAGRRRDRLTAEVDAVVREDFAGRVLPFDSAAAKAYAAIAASRRSMGRPILEADCQIAAIARASDAAVATRNGADFEHCGIALIDPWAANRASP
jgi:predicted nucleic acid-binding protein